MNQQERYIKPISLRKYTSNKFYILRHRLYQETQSVRKCDAVCTKWDTDFTIFSDKKETQTLRKWDTVFTKYDTDFTIFSDKIE